MNCDTNKRIVPSSVRRIAQDLCIGVYTINGRAAGAYARAGTRPMVDYTASDVALFIEQGTGDDQG